MSESFADLFEQSLKEVDMTPGAIVIGTVIEIDTEWVTVHAGLKSEGVIPREQFLNEEGNFLLEIGDEVKVALESVEDGFGETRLSREKAKRAESWMELEAAHESNAIVTGVINGKVKGGFTVDLNNIRAFLPGSLVDVRPVRDTLHLEGQQLEFRLIKLDRKRNNVVVSRRAVLESVSTEERDALLEKLQEGMSVKGIVKNLTDYGAFVDLGGVDGLLHITDMSWKRIKHPNEIVNVGDEVDVKVLKYDRDRNRVSLGLKQLGEDPWVAIKKRYPENSKVKAVVTNLTDYGCFAELEEGVEGLVHVSEMDWTNKNIHPSKVVQLGDEIDVMILDIDEERRRISLGIKQCEQNPWDGFAEKHKKGDKISGSIKSITDFGIFIGLEGDIDGLVHLSDISWEEPGEETVRNYTKGDEIETVILSVDPERERISLGIKQLEDDPFMDYASEYEKGSIVKGVVSDIDAKSATITLQEGVDGVLRASEISRDKVEDARNALKTGDEIEVKILSVDRKNRILSLSVKAIEIDAEKAVIKEHKNQEASDVSPGTIGDLIKAELDKS
ncbi:MAG: 30S ribosomal protein S1 [Gammaproteobacteria bacterium]|nr:30S ribosomal protein S1 [Gammaproteobacteria bacterium]MBI90838.1 30S ribosomal protein S1 [Gammaproteobacteria bacterium]MCH2577356.1 30S ribosomal protein S1 [Pseudomonadales bacterium]MEE3143376.1 30S ribosomal protein S1 [Pseudomonadota bacterium]HBY00286.1 30S ribosomal protein S1 [Gammaproteobacteria bacterium]|tara:strand:- start:645 stop:2321 length:1677 start_codon:yes stop_codon:yes gene_type:complete